MKKIIASLCILLVLAVAAKAQTSASAQEASERLAKKYSLNAVQTEKLIAIQERKIKNEAEFAAFKTSNYKLYRAKHQANIVGTEASFKRILTGKEQLALYKTNEVELRKRRAAKAAELKRQAKTAEEIQDVLVEME